MTGRASSGRTTAAYQRPYSARMSAPALLRASISAAIACAARASSTKTYLLPKSRGAQVGNPYAHCESLTPQIVTTNAPRHSGQPS
jgi:hypothetical protein